MTKSSEGKAPSKGTSKASKKASDSQTLMNHILDYWAVAGDFDYEREQPIDSDALARAFGTTVRELPGLLLREIHSGLKRVGQSVVLAELRDFLSVPPTADEDEASIEGARGFLDDLIGGRFRTQVWEVHVPIAHGRPGLPLDIEPTGRRKIFVRQVADDAIEVVYVGVSIEARTVEKAVQWASDVADEVWGFLLALGVIGPRPHVPRAAHARTVVVPPVTPTATPLLLGRSVSEIQSMIDDLKDLNRRWRADTAPPAPNDYRIRVRAPGLDTVEIAVSLRDVERIDATQAVSPRREPPPVATSNIDKIEQTDAQIVKNRLEDIRTLLMNEDEDAEQNRKKNGHEKEQKKRRLSTLRTAARFLRKAHDAPEPGEKYFLLSTCLESLLLAGAEEGVGIGARLRAAVALLLGRSQKERDELRQQVKTIYDHRCEFVHAKSDSAPAETSEHEPEEAVLLVCRVLAAELVVL